MFCGNIVTNAVKFWGKKKKKCTNSFKEHVQSQVFTVNKTIFYYHCLVSTFKAVTHLTLFFMVLVKLFCPSAKKTKNKTH